MHLRARRYGLLLSFGAFSLGLCLAGGRDAGLPAQQPDGGVQGAVSQATFGGSIFRNMVNLVDKNIPTSWNVEQGKEKNVKWVADIGKTSWAVPMVFDGRVFVSTDNQKPRDPKVKGNKAVLMCFAEKDGKFLWQNVHEMPPEVIIQEALGLAGLCSTPTVEGEYVYYVAPAGQVVCAHTKDGKIAWQYDMSKELKVAPRYLCACSPLIVADTIYLITSNGTNPDGKVVAPDAPSFIALQKVTGKLLWQSNLPGKNIVFGQWSNPVFGDVDGKPQVIFAGGDGYLYGLEPKNGKEIWRFKCTTAPTKYDNKVKAYITATPVVQNNRVIVAIGAYGGSDDAPKVGHVFCVDISKTGDVSCKNENFDPRDPANAGSALVWHFGGIVEKPTPRARRFRIGSSASTVAIKDGLVYVAEDIGYLHCLDAETGQQNWEHDLKDRVSGSPYWVDGKVYLCTGNGECQIFEHGKKLVPPLVCDMDESGLTSMPVAANGVLYISTPTKVYALAAK